MFDKRYRNHRTLILALAAISLLLAQLACDLSVEPPVTGEPAATQTPEAPRPPATSGMACFGSAGYGVTCLDETGWQTFTRDNSPLGNDYIKDIVVCPDGRLAIAHNAGISAFDGRDWKEYEGGWGHSGLEAVACDAAGNFWVAHFRGVSAFDGAGWTTYPAGQLATGEHATDLVKDVTVDPDGRVWVVTARSVAKFEGGEWAIFQAGQGFDERYYFSQVAIDSHGRPWVAHGSGLLVFDDGDWVAHQNRNLSSVESLVIDARDRPWVGTFSRGVHVLDGGGWLTYDSASSELDSNRVRAVAIDGRDRVWVGTEWGIYVFDGANWDSYRMDNADLADHNISALAVVGDGPTLPGLISKAPGSLKGRIVFEGGQPLARAAVEICVEKLGSSFSGDTPCSEQPFMQKAQTDTGGEFTIPDLPAGFYVVTVNTGDDWVQLATDLGFASGRVPVEAGEETDLGEFVVGLEE